MARINTAALANITADKRNQDPTSAGGLRRPVEFQSTARSTSGPSGVADGGTRSFDRQTQERFLSPEASRQVHFDRHSGSRTNCGFFARVSGFAQAGNPAARIGPMSRIRSASLLSAVPVKPSMVRSGKC
jgi:hypothetical protein